MKDRLDVVKELRRGRERSWFLRVMSLGALTLVLVAWFGGAIDFGDVFNERRAANLRRFLTHDAVPPTVRAGSETLWDWIRARFMGRNFSALVSTVALATLAASLAGCVGLAASAFTARTICAAREPFVAGAKASVSLRGLVGRAVRFACVVMRAIPEYILAFLLVAFFADPAVACLIALVIHNGGILGRLYGETLENLDQRPARAWYASGASRLTAMTGAQVPAAYARGLTYLLIRFETCARESTILGAVGFVSLGYWIVQERAAGRYDEMLLLVVMGAAVVVAADAVSFAVRAWIRRSS